jgi:group I intron endonuclease
MKANIKDKDKSGIYIIRNLINGKIYIGKAKCIYKRIRQHITSLNRKVKSHENDHFINSWHKYGRESFAYSVLEYLPLIEELISQKEIEYIDYYQSLNPKKGYNKRYDSSTGLIVSQDTRNKCSISQIKRFKNPEERIKLGLKSKEFWANNPEILEQMANKVANKIRKYKIGKFDYNTLELIEIYNTRKELKIKNPDYYIQAILGCCSGNKNSYKGFKWKYISIETGEIINNKK